jgi:hypothetical protein
MSTTNPPAAQKRSPKGTSSETRDAALNHRSTPADELLKLNPCEGPPDGLDNDQPLAKRQRGADTRTRGLHAEKRKAPAGGAGRRTRSRGKLYLSSDFDVSETSSDSSEEDQRPAKRLRGKAPARGIGQKTDGRGKPEVVPKPTVHDDLGNPERDNVTDIYIPVVCTIITLLHAFLDEP